MDEPMRTSLHDAQRPILHYTAGSYATGALGWRHLCDCRLQIPFHIRSNIRCFSRGKSAPLDRRHICFAEMYSRLNRVTKDRSVNGAERASYAEGKWMYGHIIFLRGTQHRTHRQQRGRMWASLVRSRLFSHVQPPVVVTSGFFRRTRCSTLPPSLPLRHRPAFIYFSPNSNNRLWVAFGNFRKERRIVFLAVVPSVIYCLLQLLLKMKLRANRNWAPVRYVARYIHTSDDRHAQTDGAHLNLLRV